MRLVGAAGFEEFQPGWVHEIRVSDPVPAAEVVAHGETVVFSTRDERDRRWPNLAAVPNVMPAGVVLPLVARDNLFGVWASGLSMLAVSSPGSWRYWSP